VKGNEKVIDKLNQMLSDELTAISQYMVHAEMCDDWGYKVLADKIEKRAIEEMKHAEKHIGRILFLEGKPIVSQLGKITIGSDVLTQLNNDHVSEETTIKAYNESIKLAADLGDNGTSDFFKEILKEEEAHIDWIEAQLDQISQMGIQNYLVEQIG
jgi:bacterioferritin